jgi:hypothetical protein
MEAGEGEGEDRTVLEEGVEVEVEGQRVMGEEEGAGVDRHLSRCWRMVVVRETITIEVEVKKAGVGEGEETRVAGWNG